MSYIAVDELGTHLFKTKPIRKFGKSMRCWTDGNGSIDIPINIIRFLYYNKYLADNPIPFDKRDMNWGDNPIELLINNRLYE